MPQPDPGVEVHGRHITVHADPSIPICADAIATADRYIEDIAAMLDVSPQPIDYYLIDGLTGCGNGQYANSSCTMGRTVYATTWIHFHELVHAVDDTYPPALFVEGLAVALSTPSKDAQHLELSRKDARLDLDSSLFRAGVPEKEYQIAGDFIRFVVERFGGARYETFAHSVASIADPVTIRRAFATAFGETLDDVIAAWRATVPSASTLAVPVDEVECVDPIAPVAAETWRVDDVVPDACRSGSTPHGTSYTQRSGRYGFEVTTPGVFLVEATAAHDNETGYVRSCATNTMYDYGTSGTSRRFLTVPLVAGRHAIELVDGVTAWSVARLGAIGDDCKTAPTFTAPAGEAWRLDLHGQASTWVRIAYDGHRRLFGTAKPQTDARACWGTCSELACEPISYNTWFDESRGRALYIVLGPASSGSSPVTVTAAADH